MQYSQENTCVAVSSLIKLQALRTVLFIEHIWGLLLYGKSTGRRKPALWYVLRSVISLVFTIFLIYVLWHHNNIMIPYKILELLEGGVVEQIITLYRFGENQLTYNIKKYTIKIINYPGILNSACWTLHMLEPLKYSDKI